MLVDPYNVLVDLYNDYNSIEFIAHVYTVSAEVVRSYQWQLVVIMGEGLIAALVTI